jgi:aminoglycoside phosphotransferase (APT) family kinase protein
VTKIAESLGLDETRERFESWLKRTLGSDEIAVTECSAATQGISSETIFVDVEGSVPGATELVVRIQPSAEQQVYMDADVLLQAAAMRAVAGHAPVPEVRWEETDPEPLGSPFFVMDRVSGRVPSTTPTFHAGGWVADLPPDERLRLATNGLEALAAINRVGGEAVAGLQAAGAGAPGLERNLDWVRRWHEWAAAGQSDALINEALAYVAENAPATDETFVSWGDCRPGNMIFGDDLEVAAVLDWEMVTLGPPEMDLGWWLMMDRWATEGFGTGPLEGWPARAESIGIYERAIGRAVRDIEYYEILAATRYAIIVVRSTNLMIAAGAIPPETTMGTNNPVTQLLAGYMGRPIPELAPEIAGVLAAMSEE